MAPQLSICIPIYQHHPAALVDSLLHQRANATTNIEILLYDDGSDDKFRGQNRQLGQREGVRYREMERNLGRAAIRNRLADDAQGHFLLFLDVDSQIIRPEFLETYLWKADWRKVICGGHTYPAECPQGRELHWLYGTQREAQKTEKRAKKPYAGFHTINFLIPAKKFQQLRFDESLTQYGHEDTLFGQQLRQQKIEVLHTGNPVKHGHLETNENFLTKTEQGLQSLLKLYEQKKLGREIKLLRLYGFLRKAGLTSFVAKRFNCKKAQWREELLSPRPSLRTFDWYRLGYLCQL